MTIVYYKTKKKTKLFKRLRVLELFVYTPNDWSEYLTFPIQETLIGEQIFDSGKHFHPRLRDIKTKIQQVLK